MSGEEKEKELEALSGSLGAVHVCQESMRKEPLTAGNFAELTGAMSWLRNMQSQLLARIQELKAELNPNVAPDVAK